MKVLAINTAFRRADVVVFYNGEIFESSIDSSSKHSENLAVCIDSVLEKTKLKLSEIDYIGCVTGPGSFTGIRIGVATSKAFLTVHEQMRAVSINSLEFIAFEFFKNNPNIKRVLVLMNALSGLFFVGIYNDKLETVLSPEMVTKEMLYTLIKNEKNYACSYEDESIFDQKGQILHPNTLIEFVLKKIDDNEIITEDKLLPVYMRMSQAEVELLKKENKFDNENN